MSCNYYVCVHMTVNMCVMPALPDVQFQMYIIVETIEVCTSMVRVIPHNLDALGCGI